MFLRRLKTTYVRSLYETLKSEETIFDKQIKFFDFCKHMSKLEKQYESDQQAQFLRLEKLKRLSLSAREPIRDVLSLYCTSRSDFSAELLTDCFHYLGKICASRVVLPYSDLSLHDLTFHWQFQQMLTDLRLALDGKEFIPPIHLASIAVALSEIGYKDAEVFGKITNYIKKTVQDATLPPARRIYKHHVYSGFQDNHEFKNHLATLLEWKYRPQVPQEKVLKDIQNFTESIHDLKYLQKNFASAIANITEQYYLLVSTQQTYDFLKENDAVITGLNHLQEVLVEAGILNPYELDDAENLENLEKLMQRAEKTFTNIVNKYYPYLNNPSIDELYEASRGFSQNEIPDIDHAEVPNPNTVTAAVVGRLTIGLGQAIHLEVADMSGNDYANVAWKIRADPREHPLDDRLELRIAVPFTKIWMQTKQFLTDMVPEFRKVSRHADMVSACTMLHGLGVCHVADKEVLDNLAERISMFQGQAQVEVEVLAKAIYGLGLANSHGDTMEILVKLLGAHPKLEEIGFSTLIQCMWGQCVLRKYNTPEFVKFIQVMNQFEGMDLSKHDNQILKELLLSFDLELKHLNIHLNYYLTMQRGFALSPVFHDNEKYFDPLKPFLSKTGRLIMCQGLTEEEARRVHKKLQETEKHSFHRGDDVIALNGFKVPIFYLADEGIYENHLLGNYQIKLNHLESMGMRGLPLPIYQILDVDASAAKISFRSIEPINEWVSRYVGIPHNLLENLDLIASDLMLLMQENHQNLADNHNCMLLLEEMLGAYKIQSLSRSKYSISLQNQSKEELKLQLLKLYTRFQSLDPSTKQLINTLVEQNSSASSFDYLVQQINSEIVAEPLTNHEFWSGTRQNMEIPVKDLKPDITDEVINQKFMMLTDYLQYKDWARDLITAYPLNSDMSMYEDELFNNFFFVHRRQQIGMLPNPLQKTNSLNQQVPLEAQIKAFLNNLKYDIKRDFSDAQIIEKILGLEIIDKLIKDHLEPVESYPKYLQRDPAAFTEFMENQATVTEDNDHYVKFYRQIYAQEEVKTELIKGLIKSREAVSKKKELRPIEKLWYHKEMTQKYAQTKEALDANDPERGIYFHPIFRQSFGYKTDPKTLRPRKETIRDESDFMRFDNDQSYLDFKQRKSEANLIKLRIFLKLHHDQPLSPLEQSYFSTYKQELSCASIHDAGSVCVRPSKTSLTFRDLPASDKNFFQGLHKASMPLGIEGYSLNELFFELGHFFDDYLIRRLEYHAIESKELKDWGLQPDPTGHSKLKPLWKNKGLWVQNSAMEEYLWRKTSHLTEKEEKDFLQLFGTFRNREAVDMMYWKMDLGSYKELMEDLKGSDFKLRFLKQWYRRKLEENDKRSGPPDGKFALPDKQIFEYRKQEIRERSRTVFEEWSGVKIEHISSKNIRRLLDMVKKEIKFNIDQKTLEIVRIIFFHPALQGRDWEELYGIIHNQEIPVYEGRFLFAEPIPVRGDKLQVEISKEDWVKRIENASSNFMPELIKKVMA